MVAVQAKSVGVILRHSFILHIPRQYHEKLKNLGSPKNNIEAKNHSIVLLHPKPKNLKPQGKSEGLYTKAFVINN